MKKKNYFFRIISWLSQEGPNSSKHLSWYHPLAVFILHYLLNTVIITVLHDSFFIHLYPSGQENPSSEISEIQFRASIFLGFYLCSLILWRLVVEYNTNGPIYQKSVCYEATWLCNMTLFMGCYGLYTGRVLIAMAHVIAVSVDQLLWYVDLIGWSLSGFKNFPIGVAKYITWPNATFLTRMTCTHHLWTIPLLIYACDGITLVSYPFSAMIVVLNVLLSRFLIPLKISINWKDHPRNISNKHQSETHAGDCKYLNVNLSHELWKDIKFSFLAINDDSPPCSVYLFRLLWRWQLFNGIIFFIFLLPIDKYLFQGDY